MERVKKIFDISFRGARDYNFKLAPGFSAVAAAPVAERFAGRPGSPGTFILYFFSLTAKLCRRRAV
jgi:hypothetical protein